ncbi:hypothetical protein AZE42_03677 [Rhizopogon vesiculosus]|uniref:Uncharacterized protein n=1 Tax=Rhizopogon vesiculosus TaxID=180088 RepID=A0A1J8PFA1_9AGAM|nr:hypothetical protein AZE42_03677 [Rhizopogon vesiculosus]
MVNNQKDAQEHPVRNERIARLQLSPHHAVLSQVDPSIRDLPLPAHRSDISDTPLSSRNAPALLSNMRTVPTHSTPTRALGVFPPPKTAEYTEHGCPIDTPHSMPPTFWRPAPKVQNGCWTVRCTGRRARTSPSINP